MNAVELSSVTKCAAGEKVLDSVSLQIGEGEVYELVGHDPGVLSALLAVASGREKPTLGTALVFGSPAHGRKGLVGVSAGAVGLAGALSLEDALRIKARRLGIRRWRQDAARIAEQLGIELARRPIRTLSCAERARALLALALLGGPCLVVLDEPYRGLSPSEGHEFSRLLRRVSDAEGVTVLCSTCEPDVAGLYSSRYGIMKGPRLAREATYLELARKARAHFKVRTTRLERDLVLLEESLPEARLTLELSPLSGEKYILLSGCEEGRLAHALDGLDSITLELAGLRPTPEACLYEGLGMTL